MAAALNRDQLLIALRLLNGPADYSPAKEIYGSLDDRDRLAIVTGTDPNRDYVAGAATAHNAFDIAVCDFGNTTIVNGGNNLVVPADFGHYVHGDHVVMQAAANYQSLAHSPERLAVSLLRGIFVAKGFLWTYNANPAGQDLSGRRVYIDEVAPTIDHANIQEASIRAILAYMVTPAAKAIMRNWHLIACASAIVFMTRGHHFVGNDNNLAPGRSSGTYSYGQLYRTILSTVTDVTAFGINDFKEIFRTALHPFGVNVFYRFMVYLRNANRLPTQFVIRSNPSPAGAAKVTTAAAIVRLMANASTVTPVKAQFDAVMAPILAADALVRQDPTLYHQTKILYTSDAPRNDDLQVFNSGMARAIANAPMLVAFANVECEGSSIAAQRCLMRGADDQAARKKRWERIFRNQDKNIENITVTEALRAEFNVPANAPAAVPPIAAPPALPAGPLPAPLPIPPAGPIVAPGAGAAPGAHP